MPLHRKDILTIVSDGVHDNLDPEFLGLYPREIGGEGETWEALPESVRRDLKARFMQLKGQEILKGVKDEPSAIVDRLISYSLNVTEHSRQWMQSHPGEKQPEAGREFPGKMDHTTCIAYRVNKVGEEELERNKVTPSNRLPGAKRNSLSRSESPHSISV